MAMICVYGGRECDGCMECLDRYTNKYSSKYNDYEEDD